MGIPKDSVLQYESAVKNDKFLLLVRCSALDVAKAKEVLDTSQPVYLQVHSEAVLTASV